MPPMYVSFGGVDVDILLDTISLMAWEAALAIRLTPTITHSIDPELRCFSQEFAQERPNFDRLMLLHNEAVIDTISRH